jgi:hemoglobin
MEATAMTWRRTIGTLAATAVLVAGCSGGMQGGTTMMEKKPLYDRLGGKPAIMAVVDDFIGNVAGDARINKRFATADIPRLKTMLVNQICQVSGGPCIYTGASMKDAHKGMKISDAEFTALVEDLVKSLDKFNVGAQEKNDLLGALGGMKPDIVNQ